MKSIAATAEPPVDHVLKLLADEDGDDRRRCLLSAKAEVISRNSRGLTEQIRMAVNCFHNAGKNQKELDILMRCYTRIQHIDAGVGSQGPVVMFTGTVDALERFLVEQAICPRRLSFRTPESFLSSSGMGRWG